MIKKGIFKKPNILLEEGGYQDPPQSPSFPEEMWTKCPSCQSVQLNTDIRNSFQLCPECGYHFKMGARQRIDLIFDPDSFNEVDSDLSSINILGFPDYDKKLNKAQAQSGEQEAVITGTGRINGILTAGFVMEPLFMMGSMGTVVGEKITRLFEYATGHSLPVVGFTVSGGARMQEGILSLMQMAKTSGAVKRHSDSGGLYITVLTDPTTGGVTASFAMQGDILIAEPEALIGFAGPRVIEQTIQKKLPAGFQRSEFLLRKGFIDMVVDRKQLKSTLFKLLRLHREVPL